MHIHTITVWSVSCYSWFLPHNKKTNPWRIEVSIHCFGVCPFRFFSFMFVCIYYIYLHIIMLHIFIRYHFQKFYHFSPHTPIKEHIIEMNRKPKCKTMELNGRIRKQIAKLKKWAWDLNRHSTEKIHRGQINIRRYSVH